MRLCPRCGGATIRAYAGLRALAFSRPACPGCANRISYFAGVHLAFMLKVAALKALPAAEYEGFFDAWGVTEAVSFVVVLAIVWVVIRMYS